MYLHLKMCIFFFLSEVASSLSYSVSIIDLACKDEKAFALSSLLQVPLIKVDGIEDDTPHKYAMSVRPSYRVVCKALFDVMKFYSFKRVAVVYDGKHLPKFDFYTRITTKHLCFSVT